MASTSLPSDPIQFFEQQRPNLMNISYRILGSVVDAEDVVQDTLVSWLATEYSEITNPAGWLTTVCVRKAVDVLKSAKRARTNYVGAWLPEPMHTKILEDTPESDLSLAESVSMAFLLVLERLAPKERAAFLMHDIFDMAYQDVAANIDASEAACRKLVSRARENIKRDKVSFEAPLTQQKQMLDAFMDAVKTGATKSLVSMLSSDVLVQADSGGKVASIDKPLAGIEEATNFAADFLGRHWQAGQTYLIELNAGLALVYCTDERPETVLTFGYDQDLKLNRIFITRNPEKLSRLPDMKASMLAVWR